MTGLHWLTSQRSARLATVATLVIGIGIAFAIAQIVGLASLAFDAGAYLAATPGDFYHGWENRPNGEMWVVPTDARHRNGSGDA